MVVSEKMVDELLSNSDALFNNIFAFECTLHSMPGKSHRGLTITHQDLVERTEDFVLELRNTMSSWVYSKSKYKSIIDDAMIKRGGDVQNASSFVQTLVRQKFRRGHPQGQFGELLLFNVIQHFHHAIPLLRKMPITTNAGIERHGADAIHYRPSGDKHLIYVGEAKTYASKYKFATAIKDAINSIFDSYEKLSNELGLYTYEDFIEDELREVAKGVKDNSLKNVVHELVCVVSYEETESKSRPTEAEIKVAMKDAVEKRMKDFDIAFFKGRCPFVLGRLHLMAVPVWGLEKLMEAFDQ